MPRRVSSRADAGERLLEIALDVVGQRLERRDVDDARHVRKPALDALAHERVDRREKRGERLARAGRRGDQRVPAARNRRPGVGWAAVAPRKLASNQAWTAGWNWGQTWGVYKGEDVVSPRASGAPWLFAREPSQRGRNGQSHAGGHRRPRRIGPALRRLSAVLQAAHGQGGGARVPARALQAPAVGDLHRTRRRGHGRRVHAALSPVLVAYPGAHVHPVRPVRDAISAAFGRRAGTTRAAADYGRAVGAGALELSTATDNGPAQRLYESEGWVRDTAFYVYGLGL